MTPVLTLDSVWAFIGLIVGFGLIIFVHELGHFLVAKAVGIKCLQFAIGMGHAVCAYRRGLGLRLGSTEAEYQKQLAAGRDPESLGETEYRICWAPIGGYVKMLGQDDVNPAAFSTDPRAFTSKPVWARACVVSAGVVMNIILAVAFFVISFMAGVRFPPAVVGMVVPDMPAATTFATGHQGDSAYLGLQVGDRLTRIDGEPVNDFLDVAIRAALSAPQASLTLTVQRDRIEEPLQFTMTPKLSEVTDFLALGIGPPKSVQVIDVPRLKAAGVEPGMRVRAAGGQPIQNYGQLHRLISEARGRPVTVDFTDASGDRTVSMEVAARPGLMSDADQTHHLVGWVPGTRVAFVVPDSPANRAGLKTGDVVAAIDRVEWPGHDVIQDMVRQSEGRTLELIVLRQGGSVVPIQVQPVTINKQTQIGIHMQAYAVAATLPKSPAAALDLRPGSTIHSVDGIAVADWADLQRILQDRCAQGHDPVVLTIGYLAPRPHAVASPSVAGAVEDHPALVKQGQIEIDRATASALLETPWLDPMGGWVDNLRLPVVASGPIQATAMGLVKTKQIMQQTYLTLARLVQGTVKVKQLRGPVGIVHEGTRIARQGWTYLVFFLGLISVNLAVINFLPIPIVDGGLMTFLIIEKLRGSPVSPRVHMAATVVGLTLIGSVLLLTLFHDTLRLFGGG